MPYRLGQKLALLGLHSNCCRPPSRSILLETLTLHNNCALLILGVWFQYFYLPLSPHSATPSPVNCFSSHLHSHTGCLCENSPPHNLDCASVNTRFRDCPDIAQALPRHCPDIVRKSSRQSRNRPDTPDIVQTLQTSSRRSRNRPDIFQTSSRNFPGIAYRNVAAVVSQVVCDDTERLYRNVTARATRR